MNSLSPPTYQEITHAETAHNEVVFGKDYLRNDRDHLAGEATTVVFINTVESLCSDDWKVEGPHGTLSRTLWRSGASRLVLQAHTEEDHGFGAGGIDRSLVAAPNIKSDTRLLKPRGRSLGLYTVRESVFVDREHQIARLHRTLDPLIVLGPEYKDSATKQATEEELQQALDHIIAAVREDESIRASL